MVDWNNMKRSNLEEKKVVLEKRYKDFKARNLSLDMTRGKPCPEQLDLSLEMLKDAAYIAKDGTDCRNYGVVDGIPEAKELFARFLEVASDEVIVGGNASLNLMNDTIMRAMILGFVDSKVPWGKLPAVKFLCPSPGYDRHFAVCEYLGIEMIPVSLNDNGPDMDKVEKLVSEDEAIKGMWCVPKYSNPTGITYSDDVVDRLARMKTKAKDFRIFWDNAYTVHHFTDTYDSLKNILETCKEAGNPERVFIFGSTSKISFAGAGVAVMAGSRKNIDYMKKYIGLQTIGPDKINQLRHVRFFKDMEGIEFHMKKHAAILKPKFDAVQSLLEQELGDSGIASWTRPNGGYFVSIDTMGGCAKKIVKMAAETGVKLTPAGATFPYGNDPKDCNIRIAPSYPSVEEIKLAMELVTICIQLESIRKLTGVEEDLG